MENQFKVAVINGIQTDKQKLEGMQVNLPNPKTGQIQRYWKINDSLYEVQWFKLQYSSWFVGNYVYSDGGMYMFSKLDPVFILLGYLTRSQQENKKLTENYQDVESLLDCSAEIYKEKLMFENKFELICEWKEVCDDKYFKFDESKVIGWLKCKMEMLRKGFEEIADNPLNKLKEEKHKLQYLIQFLGEYCSDEWIQILYKEYKVEELEKKLGVTTVSGIEQPIPKRQKVTPKEAARRTQEQAKKNKLIKNSVGTMKINKFFVKKQ
eukprot:TRINITY_DN108775_c0_g1_i1.p2 TRINITY_DN108775_c0_g1~~TRINITY_DN108775_c0_g1_i1.p2  ORF type:complete len:266 (-),score=32.30 TRINITY_DN108775_c0_g1_i1:142-939(-)